MLSEPTSSKRLFMSVILPSVSSCRLIMVKVVALATDEEDSVDEVETEEESADTVDPDVAPAVLPEELSFVYGVKDTTDEVE